MLKLSEVGHLVAQCREGTKARVCERCSSHDHSVQNCNSDTLNCINCIRKRAKNIGHSTASNPCPVFMQNRRIRIAMSKLGLGYKDAELFILKQRHTLGEEWFNVDIGRNIEHPIFGDFIPWSDLETTSSANMQSNYLPVKD